MHLGNASGQLWIVLSICAAVTAADAAVVYKWTDADGVVHFSDQAVPGAEKIYTATSSTSNGVGGQSPSTTGARPPDKPTTGTLMYTTLTLDSPAKDEVFFGDDVVSANLQIVPALVPGHAIVWHLNGRALDDQPPDALTVTLQQLPRGTYAIAATVTNPDTGESQTSDTVTFFVRQPSELAPQHKK